MEKDRAWDMLPNDILVVVMAYLSGKQIAKLATVSKQFYVCTSDNSLWKRKFMQDYDQLVVKKLAGRGQEAEQAFLELLQPDHPEHYVLTDWKSGYVMKVINNTTNERLQCFANCLANIAEGYTMLNGHDLTRFLFMPKLVEPILPLKIERIFSRREERNKAKPIAEYKNELGTKLFKKIMAESTPEQLNLKYLLVNGAKHPEFLDRLLQSNAPSICLFGKWFNQANSRNFPFLLKFDADLELTEWLFTYGYERSAIVVMTIAPNAVENAAKQWYLQPYDKTTGLLIYLRNHLAHWFSVSPKTFCWIYDAVTLYSICHSFELKFVDKLFYNVKIAPEGQEPVREPVVDSYFVFGNEFFLGELPHETMLLQRDQPLKECENLPANNADERSVGMLQYKQDRQAFLHGADKFGDKLKAMSTPEEQHAYQMHVREMLLKLGATPYVSEFYHLVGAFGEFWEREECKEVLANAAITKAVLDELQERLTVK